MTLAGLIAWRNTGTTNALKAMRGHEAKDASSDRAENSCNIVLNLFDTFWDEVPQLSGHSLCRQKVAEHLLR
jgi:hypothetical protein